MINNINNYSHFFSGNTTNSSSTEVDEIIASHKSPQETATSTVENSQSHLFLSSKAQKINAISNEFFTGNDMSFDDIDALKTRAYQLGLINKEEYGQLSNTEYSAEEIQASKDLSTTGIAHYITDFLQRLDDSDAGKTENATANDQEDNTEESDALVALKSALTNAKKIIEDVESEKANPEFKATLIDTISVLKDTINASAFEKMPLDDNVGLTKVYQTLEIVDKISPQRLTNEKLNRYMSVSLG
ncbi:hypothetical protein [Thalassotalea hakodatensis]|uniref:hypothetical protein n=1 Tax=Thalassotalea hakodatensis TaxID=3030492 RepID=UPI0025737155|nr:hypothetical protein [Thalassotalea hakodatensis]